MRSSFVKIKPEIYYIACAGILILPLNFLICWTISVFIHELFHYIAIKLSGGNVYHISVGIFGVKMDTEPLQPWQEILCAIAGPIGGLLLFFLFLKSVPLLAVFSLAHSLYNLIPLFPLDGGRVVHGLISVIFRHKNYSKIFSFADKIIAFLLILLASYCTIGLNLGIFPLILIGAIIAKNKKIKCT